MKDTPEGFPPEPKKIPEIRPEEQKSKEPYRSKRENQELELNRKRNTHGTLTKMRVHRT
jgi:hypothetical protein